MDLENNYGLLTSDEQRHELAVQIDIYNATFTKWAYKLR